MKNSKAIVISALLLNTNAIRFIDDVSQFDQVYSNYDFPEQRVYQPVISSSGSLAHTGGPFAWGDAITPGDPRYQLDRGYYNPWSNQNPLPNAYEKAVVEDAYTHGFSPQPYPRANNVWPATPVYTNYYDHIPRGPGYNTYYNPPAEQVIEKVVEKPVQKVVVREVVKKKDDDDEPKKEMDDLKDSLKSLKKKKDEQADKEKKDDEEEKEEKKKDAKDKKEKEEKEEKTKKEEEDKEKKEKEEKEKEKKKSSSTAEIGSSSKAIEAATKAIEKATPRIVEVAKEDPEKAKQLLGVAKTAAVNMAKQLY